MVKAAILEPNRKYNFSDYFKLDFDSEAILDYFGFGLEIQRMALPKAQLDSSEVTSLTQRIDAFLPHITLSSEIARREFLIAPVLMDLIRFISLKVKVSYWIEVSEQLRGALDYYLQAESNLLVIEAKDENLQRGFTQLAVELIALHHWTEVNTSYLYGAVSIGNVWQFSRCDRQNQVITQDLNLYRVPADLAELVSILVGILKGLDSDTLPDQIS
ncbi:MAG: hypothetical protein VKK80_06680 [Prochlorothrix sp.]|nr:hypothetical protein [Prochlorothrix sp.]